MIRELKADLKRYQDDTFFHNLLNIALWNVVCYRFGHWVQKENPPKILTPALKAFYLVVSKFFELTDNYLDAQAEIGEGLYIGHAGGIHINPEAVIGKNCSLGQQVTIGTSGMGRKGVATIGDNVYIGVGAKIIGKIHVGDGAKIAANSLVLTNVPAGATVIGVPARVVMKGGIHNHT
jgi:serine O-acetyltransferase